MQINAIENSFFQVAVDPFLKRMTGILDRECPTDGGLLINSLKDFLGESTSLCRICQHVNPNTANPFYRFARRFLRVDKDFMRSQLLNNQCGEA